MGAEMSERERRDRAIGRLCDLVSWYLVIGLFVGASMAVTWLIATLGGLK